MNIVNVDGRLSPNLLRYSPILFGFIIFILLILSVSHWLIVPFQSFDSNNSREAFLNFVFTASGVIILFGLYFVFKKITDVEKTIDFAKQDLVTEKLTWAIKQLRNRKTEVQLAGVFTLERIARESEKYHWEIMEILTAFVRENAHYSGNAKNPGNGHIEDSSNPNKAQANIQTILTVIGRRQWIAQEIEQSRFIDLENTALQNLDLRRAHLAGANFCGADLEGAQLAGANLTGTNLVDANLKNANLSKANLKRADLGGAKLEGANLKNANMQYSNLERANLKGMKVKGTDFLNANLKGAFLINTNLEDANTEGADLEGAFFMELY